MFESIVMLSFESDLLNNQSKSLLENCPWIEMRVHVRSRTVNLTIAGTF